MLHLFNGDAAPDVALRAGLPGEVAVWADTLDQGPLPSHLDGPALREARAQSFAACEGGYGSLDEIRGKVSRWNAALAATAEHAEVASHPGIFLVCIGDHPAVPRFRGPRPARRPPARRAVSRQGGGDGSAARARARGLERGARRIAHGAVGRDGDHLT
jgi:hypothetical protein